VCHCTYQGSMVRRCTLLRCNVLQQVPRYHMLLRHTGHHLSPQITGGHRLLSNVAADALLNRSSRRTPSVVQASVQQQASQSCRPVCSTQASLIAGGWFTLSAASKAIPAARSCLTTSVCPLLAALCRAVFPSCSNSSRNRGGGGGGEDTLLRHVSGINYMPSQCLEQHRL
jgi:hypothetical protein